jgi:hypothetical protein
MISLLILNMMKSKLVLLLLFIPVLLLAQTPYDDALYLKNQGEIIGDKFQIKIIPETKSKVRGIFGRYVNDLDDLDDLATVLPTKYNNPFISVSGTSQLAVNSAHEESFASSFAKIGGLDVTSFADGIARFLVSRAKQELNIYFFDQFNQFLKNSEHGKDVQALFPNTYSFMLLAGDNMYQYQQYLQALREAFTQDLSSLLLSINTWATQDKAKATAIVKAIQEQGVYKYVQLALFISTGLQEGKHPGDILNELSTTDFIRSIDADLKDFSSSVKAVNLFSQSIRSTNETRYWISQNDFRSFEDPVFVQIYLGLIYQQCVGRQDIKFGSRSLSDLLKDFAGNVARIKPFLNSLKQVTINTDQLISQLQNKTGSVPAQHYISIAQFIPKAVNILPVLSQSISNAALGDDPEFILTHVFNLMADLRTQSYSAGIFELMVILQKLNISDKGFTDGLLKYGTFMATISSAKTAEEVQQAIETIALPPGSYQVKRESRANISLNGYLGLYGSGEYLPASKQNNSFSAGVFAPVGVAFSAGGYKRADDRGGKSHSLFVSVIDVGTLASFRFMDPNTSVASTIQLKDIVAPGLYYVFGFGKSPVSIGAGAQLGPNLRDIDPAGAPKINEDYYFRYGGFIAVDIPIITLYNRKDKKQKK